MGKVYDPENAIIEEMIIGGSLKRIDSNTVSRPDEITSQDFHNSLRLHARRMVNNEIRDAYDQYRLGKHAFKNETVDTIIKRYVTIICSLYSTYCYSELNYTQEYVALKGSIEQKYQDAIEE